MPVVVIGNPKGGVGKSTLMWPRPALKKICSSGNRSDTGCMPEPLHCKLKINP